MDIKPNKRLETPFLYVDLKKFSDRFDIILDMCEEGAMGMANEIPSWILQCLDQYGNCAYGYTITKQYGEEKLLSVLKDNGYPCKLGIVTDVKDEPHIQRIMQLTF